MYVLTRTIGSYSSGTRVILLNFTKAHTAFIQIQRKGGEVLEVSQDDITERRERTAVVTVPNSRERRRVKRQLAKENLPNESGEQ